MENTIKLVDNNLSKEEHRLTNNTNIVIQKADKVNTFVMLDKESYCEKLEKHDHLNFYTYVKIDSNSDQKVFSRSNHSINKHAECLKEHKYLTHCLWKSSNFYVIPKINKNQEIIEEIKNSNEIYI